MGDVTDLLGRVRGRKAESGLPMAEQSEQPQAFDDDLVPDIESHKEDELDRVLLNLGIIEAYNRWSRKGTVEANQRKTEGIKVRCPNPAHPDKNPSAWLNTDKDVWACGGCGFSGGDVFDIAAWHFGYSVPGYKGKDFPKLKQDMARDLGYQVTKTIGGQVILSEPQENSQKSASELEESSELSASSDDMAQIDDTSHGISPHTRTEDSTGTSAIDRLKGNLSPPVITPPRNATPTEDSDTGGSRMTPPPEDSDETPDNVIHITPRPSDPDAEILSPQIDWRDITESDTFLGQWMKATKDDDLPEEYYFWLGMSAVGLAVANRASLADNPPVKGNLFLCFYGPTGIGKSRSVNNMWKMLTEALPYEEHTSDEGVRLTPGPSSAEALVDFFAETDPSGNPVPVTGLVKFDELATLIDRSNRQGSALKPTLMEFYDSYNPVELRSRGHGHVRAEKHFASVTTTTQPRAIRTLLTQTDADAGFVNRWLFATGVTKTPIAMGRKEINHDDCVTPLRNIREWASIIAAGDGRIGITDAALAQWTDFFHDELVPDKKSDTTNMLSRIDLTMKKIMTLLAFDRRHRMLEIEDVVDAIKLYEYLKTSYEMLSRQIGVGVFEDCRMQLKDHIVGFHSRTKLYPTPRDILNAVKGRFSASLIKSVLETMISLGEVQEMVSPGKDGQPGKVRYKYLEYSEA